MTSFCRNTRSSTETKSLGSSGKDRSFSRKMSLCALAVTLASLTVKTQASAHPVVFAGGIAVMTHTQGPMSEFESVFSPTSRIGLGGSLTRDHGSTDLLAKSTFLIWRGNFPDFQSNLYLTAGAGRRWSSDVRSSYTSNQSALFHWSAGADGEDRRIYTMAKYAQTIVSSDDRREHGMLRVGFAPYAAQTNELTLWGLLEWAPQKASRTDEWAHTLTPLVRMFYRNALIEFGSSVQGTVTVNTMFHFF
jgi:hypothetical protein